MPPGSFKGSADAWRALTFPEKALFVARQELDLGAHEEGDNRGAFPKKYLATVGLDEGYPWCAAFVSWCLVSAGLTAICKGAAAVRNWPGWDGVVPVLNPRRGDLMYWLNKDGTGHIGFVCQVLPGFMVRTIEGNTNADGGREGVAVLQKFRYYGMGSKLRFLRLSGVSK